MAVTTSWEINTMERDISDGYVTKILYRLKCFSDSEEKFRFTGEINLTKPESLPSDFIDFTSLNSSTVITWVKNALGATRVTELETQIKEKVDKILTPASVSGVPASWS